MSLRLFVLGFHQELCQVSVHREGVNPSSMDGVPDLRGHNSFIVIKIVYYESSSGTSPNKLEHFETLKRYKSVNSKLISIVPN